MTRKNTEEFVQRAVARFDRTHVIEQETSDRILYKEPGTSSFRLEFVDLDRSLCVHGDIASAIFSYYTGQGALRDKVKWIGTSHVGYAAKKWAAGMGIPAVAWEEEQALEDLETFKKEEYAEWLKDAKEDLFDRVCDNCKAHNRAVPTPSHMKDPFSICTCFSSEAEIKCLIQKAEDAFEEAETHIYDHHQNGCVALLADLIEDYEALAHFGEVLRPRVVWSYAACVSLAKKLAEG